MTKFSKKFAVLTNGKYDVIVKNAIYVEGGIRTLSDGTEKLTEDNVQLTLSVIGNENPDLNGLEMTKILSLSSRADVFTNVWFAALSGLSVRDLMTKSVDFDTDKFVGKELEVAYTKLLTNDFPMINLITEKDFDRHVEPSKEKKAPGKK